MGVGIRTSERKKGEDDAKFGSSSRVNKLKPDNTDNKWLQSETQNKTFSETNTRMQS